MTNSTNNNPYGRLLDKYLEPSHVSPYETRKQREEEARERYGNLLDYAKPDNSMLELMVKIEDDRIERRKQEAQERELADRRRQARIEEERRKEDEHNAQVRDYAESLIERKQEQLKAAAEKREQERKEAEKQQEIYDRIDNLMQISPGVANAYIHAIKEGKVI